MAGKTLTFGVSGYLYRSAVLYFDDQTETFWEQMTGKAVMGPLIGKSLKWLPSEVTTWREWRKAHPETTVLKPPRPPQSYGGGYKRYRQTQRVFFPTGPNKIDNTKYRNKDSATVVVVDGKARCYPHPALEEGETQDGARKIVKKGISVRVFDENGKEIPSLFTYWFAVNVYYPKATIYEPPAKQR